MVEALPTRICLGIGNPGPEYEGTRHNVGFQVLDRMAAALGVRFAPAEGPVLAARGATEAGPFLLVKPQAFVNTSGEALLGHLAGGIPGNGDLLVILDDLALPPGALRLREKGSAGGHNGLRSIIGALGTESVPRLRIGIGGVPAGEWREHVLSPFRPEEAAVIDAAVGRAVRVAVAFLRGQGWPALQNELDRASPPASDRGTGMPEHAARAAPAPLAVGRGVLAQGGSDVEQKLNKYEGMFLLHNGRVPPEGGGAASLVGELLKKHGAAVVRLEVWDERKLAYPVQDQKRGTYVLAHFEAQAPAVNALNHDVSISEDVLRALVVRHELEFPTFRTAADMAAFQPRKELFGAGRRRGDDDEGGRGGDEYDIND